MKKIDRFALAALMALALAACSSPEKEEQRAEQFEHNESSLLAAQRNATVDCTAPAQCDAAWAQTKRYIEQNSDTTVIHADASGIDTDVPDSGKVALSATRVAKGAGATLTLFAQCRDMYGPDKAKGSDYDKCAGKILKAQNGYGPFLQAHVSGQ